MTANTQFHGVLSKNPRMHAIFDLISTVGHTGTTVLIEGETGTGKEQMAKALHDASTNRNGPMVAVNCAALPETLLESELFGHEKGAFTNAVCQRKGRFETADKGTVFLDEVGDVPAAMQAKLLRVLQERCFERVGGTEQIEVDVRVVAATNRPLHRLVKHGKFREDLYYRLNVVRIELPPLRERREDIPLLAGHFLQKYALPGEATKQITAPAMQVLMTYRWPGNIRELENVIERAAVTSHESKVDVADLPPELAEPTAQSRPFQVTLERPLPELVREATANIERQYLRKALKKRTATWFGPPRSAGCRGGASRQNWRSMGSTGRRLGAMGRFRAGENWSVAVIGNLLAVPRVGGTSANRTPSKC